MATLWDDFYNNLSKYARNLDLNDLNYASNISLKYRYLYIEVAKAGCSSIKLTLQRLELEDPDFFRENFEHLHNRAYSPLLRLQNVPKFEHILDSEEFLKFTFVRNPYTRVLSAYIDKIKNKSKYEREIVLGLLGKDLKNSDYDISFYEFVDAICEQPIVEMNPHWRPQYYSICKDHISYDFIGRFESFDEDFFNLGQKISPKFNDYFKSEKRHSTGASSKIAEYYSDDIAEKVYRLYKKDFISFGYSKDRNFLNSEPLIGESSRFARISPHRVATNYLNRTTLGLMQSRNKKVGLSPEDKITVVIPFRYSPHLFQAIERLEKIVDTVPAEYMDILLVDYGSNSSDVKLYDFIYDYPNAAVHRVECPEGLPFSIGEARDLGAQHAKGRVIIFHDVDFLCSRSMYIKVYHEALAREIFERNASEFFCVPVAFLNQYGANTYLSLINEKEENVFDVFFQQKLITESKKLCDFLVYGSSAIVVNRYHYLRIGGHSKSFSGHGAEDYDVLHRLSAFYKKGPRSANYYKDTKTNEILNYEGFRAYFALYGVDVFMKGVFMVHLWHPTRAIPDYFQSKRNFELLGRLMRDFDKLKVQPPALQDGSCTQKTLILAQGASAFVRSIRDALPLMGKVVFIDETKFVVPKDLTDYLVKNDINIVGFKNPYGNEHRLKLYNVVKGAGLKYWVFDRGALPDSWFFDSAGFNYDSDNYHREHWDIGLTSEQINDAKNYISKVRGNDETLEKNGMRVGSEHLREYLGVNGQKIMFIPFQRPSDSVCKYFAGDMGSAEGFYQLVKEVSVAVSENYPDWVVLGKKHPLEDTMPDLPNIRFVPESTHIYDLIEISDLILLLNSGVGLLSAVFGKPVLHAGRAFYSIDGVNVPVSNCSQVLAHLDNPPLVDSSLLEKFIYHLRYNVYSFGKASYRQVRRSEDGGKLSLADKIIFEEIRGLSERPVLLGSVPAGVGLDEPLFYSYGGRDGVMNKSVQKIKPNDYRIKSKPVRLMIFLYLSKPFMADSKRVKLERDPAGFFRDAKGGFTKIVGRIIGFS